MKLRISFFFIAICIGTFATAQGVRKAEITGTVYDDAGTTLTGGTVMLLHTRDSVLASFASTGADGAFTLKNVAGGEYVLKITYVGFSTYTTNVTVGDQSPVVLGSIHMSAASEVLAEVEVVAEHIPIQIKKDTIEYNADAFQTQPNAVVEDLLKRLPGVEVDADGTIRAQGETVQNIFVDGKEFFGTDPKMATKNLPARAVKKVKVYDRLSDMAEFSGIDDGERQRTINLELREEFKTGLFGTAEAGYGSDERHMIKANINRFTKKSQASVLALFNNINEQGFTFEESMNFSGGMRGFSGGRGGVRSGDVPMSQGVGNGLTGTLAGGLNYNFTAGKKLDVRSSYFYSGVENDLLQNTFRHGFLNNATYDTYEDRDQLTNNTSHRLNLRGDFKIDSTQNLELRSNAGFNFGELRSMQMQRTFSGENVLENQGSVTNIRDTDRFNVSGDLFYRKRLQRKGRSLTGNLSLNSRNEDGDIRLNAVNEYLTTGNTEVLDQLQTTLTDYMQWGGQFSFTEPLGNNQYLEVRYEYQDEDETSIRDASDIDGSGNQIPNPLLSTRFNRDLTLHRPGVTYRFNTPKTNLSIGAQYQDTDLTGLVNDGEALITKHVQSVLPSVRWRYEIATARVLRGEYRTSINVPSVSQLSPIIENNDPLKIYVGNPDLRAAYSHRGSLHFHSFSQFSFTSIFAMLSGTWTKNRVVNATTVNEQFVEVTTPVNIDNDYQLNGNASFGTPLKFIKSRIQLNANVSYNKSLIPINAVLNDLDRWSGTMGLQFQNQNIKHIEYAVGANWTKSTTTYSETPNRDQQFFTHHYFGNVTLTFLKNWTLNTAMDYRLFTGDQFAENQALPIWRASLSRFILEGKRGQIRLSVFDVLDENQGLSRNSSANYLEEIRANSIGRYAMLSFLYSIKGFGQQSGMQGGMRMMGVR